MEAEQFSDTSYEKNVQRAQKNGLFFKAVQPNMASFQNARFRYRLGKSATAQGKQRDITQRGLLHFSRTPAETLFNGVWPCRLLVIDPQSPVLQQETLCAARSLVPLCELPAWMAFGPTGRFVASFLDLYPTARTPITLRAIMQGRFEPVDQAVFITEQIQQHQREIACFTAIRCIIRAIDGSFYDAINAVRALLVHDVLDPQIFEASYHHMEASIPFERVRAHADAMISSATISHPAHR